MSVPTFLVLLAFVSQMPAEVNYNPKEEMCCNGTVFKRDGVKRNCCGSKPYKASEHACCNGDLFPFPSESRRYFCCADSEGIERPYDYTKQKCCDGNLLDVKGVKDPGCCKGHLYSTTTEMCCNGQAVEAKPGLSCCGGLTIYNETEQTCCEVYEEGEDTLDLEIRLFQREGNKTECCGWEIYDPAKDTCCEDGIEPLPENYEQGDTVSCCLEQPYIEEKEECCTVEKEDDDGQEVIVHAKVHKKGQWTTCCGLETINYRKQVCCDDNSVLEKPKGNRTRTHGSCCAGKVILDNDEEFCHDGQIRSRDGYSFCGGVPYEEDSEFCCGDQIFQKQPDMKCCQDSVAYSSKNETCCGDAPIPLTEDDVKTGRTSCCL